MQNHSQNRDLLEEVSRLRTELDLLSRNYSGTVEWSSAVNKRLDGLERRLSGLGQETAQIKKTLQAILLRLSPEESPA